MAISFNLVLPDVQISDQQPGAPFSGILFELADIFGLLSDVSTPASISHLYEDLCASQGRLMSK